MNGLNNELEECERKLSCPVSKLANCQCSFMEKLGKAINVSNKHLGRVAFLLNITYAKGSVLGQKNVCYRQYMKSSHCIECLGNI
jgi:hypothetical protein